MAPLGDLDAVEHRVGVEQRRGRQGEVLRNALSLQLSSPTDQTGPFAPDVLAAAAEAASSPTLPATDATDLELVTIDPPGSRDLDQAVGIENRGDDGWRVRYAIADVGAWVEPGGAVDLGDDARRAIDELEFAIDDEQT